MTSQANPRIQHMLAFSTKAYANGRIGIGKTNFLIIINDNLFLRFLNIKTKKSQKFTHFRLMPAKFQQV